MNSHLAFHNVILSSLFLEDFEDQVSLERITPAIINRDAQMTMKLHTFSRLKCKATKIRIMVVEKLAAIPPALYAKPTAVDL